MSSIVVYLTDSKKFGYRELPLSFEGIWKEGNMIKTEDGSEKCKIIQIIPNTSENRTHYTNIFKALIKQEATPSVSKISFNLRSDLKEIIKNIQEEITSETSANFLSISNLRIEDFNTKNVIKCFTNLNVNGHLVNCKVVKLNAKNTLTFDFITKYMKCGIESISLKFSILDKNYTYKIEDNKILLQKRGVDYTLKIIHINSDDIIDRLPRYMNERRRIEKLYNRKSGSDIC